MYTNQVVSRVLALHQSGHSQRAIAKRLQLSRSFVWLVVTGKRRLQPDVKIANQTINETAFKTDISSPYRTASGYVRCRRCGFHVVQPCSVCEAQDWLDKMRCRKATLTRKEERHARPGRV